ncbi:acetyl-CoA carboxylase biotin carboxyl carrier protein [uncultured Neglectibacter sp.]|uniref:acetyl-CoA carboxylase biotin carboxyl carrier protein n=1 Tax=uncultured Neglectibacter sp. TaxID=1924108 RepID=UPI0034DF520C
MDIKHIEELARVMRENDLTALEVQEGDAAIKLERKQEIAAALAAAMPAQRASSPFAPAGTTPIGTEPAPKAEGTVVASPTVGVFYAAASPDSKPFVEVGDKVKKGDILCIIEAMKLMNEIPAEIDGTVAEVCAINGQVVEYDQPLFRIV